MTESNRQVLFDQLTAARSWRVDGSSAVRFLGLCWIGAAGWAVGSDLGLWLGVGLAAIGLIARPVTTVAVGHAALIALLPDVGSISSLLTLGVFEGGLLLLLVSERPVSPIVAILTLSGAGGLAAAAGLVFLTVGLAAASALIVVILATVSALLYRYERYSVDRIVAARREIDDSPQTTDP